MQLFYNPDLSINSKTILFSKEESRHIVKVLRKKESDILYITNGKGELFNAEINFADEKKCSAIITNIDSTKKPWNYYIHVAIAPTKNIDRFEWFLEKATEIGIDEITPIICQNSERRIVKSERLEKIILSGMKQSLKFHLPKLNKPTKFSDLIDNPFQGNKLIAHCEPSKKESIHKLTLNERYNIFIGPEGDFSNEEIKKAISSGFKEITLGESRLRTETAGLVAVQNFSFIHQS